MSPPVIAAIISGCCSIAATVGAVVLTARLQTRRIDAQNRAALQEQTGQIRQHLDGGAS